MKTILKTVVLSAALIGNAQAAELQPSENQPEENVSTSSSSSTSSSEASHFQTSRMNSPVIQMNQFTWTGFYAGVHLGGGFGDSTVATTGQVTANVNNVNGGARPASVTLGRPGILGGAQVGYNRQFGRTVFGVETDLGGSSIHGQRTIVTTALTGGASLNNNFSSDLKYLGTVRGRVGFGLGRALLYGTGGFAYGSSDHSANFFGASPANVLQFTGNNSKVKGGYVVGGGGEFAFHKKLSLKAEYLYYELGTDVINVAVIAGSGGGGTGYDSRFENKGNLVRGGLNYRF